jgi:hypothetical protein
MFRDGKRQAGAAGFLRHPVDDTMPELLRAPGGIITAAAVEVFTVARTIRLN